MSKGTVRPTNQRRSTNRFTLILSSLDRIETVSTAMELRRFGQKKSNVVCATTFSSA